MKYGLQLRSQPSQQKKQPARPPLPPLDVFRDEDEDDIEREISRQASKNKALKDIGNQLTKALAEDPSVFDYDGVYDDMKEKAVRPLAVDRHERKPKYIQALIEKAKVREREHEIVYERKLAKERNKDDHLYAGKDKFVTGAYKKKLAEQAKWEAEERLRQLQEDKEDITKKGDMTEFYFNLSKNVAFGAKEVETSKKREKPKEEVILSSETKPTSVGTHSDQPHTSEKYRGEFVSPPPKQERSNSVEPKVMSDSSKQEVKSETEADQAKADHHKRNKDALAAAKERFLARKKNKVQEDY